MPLAETTAPMNQPNDPLTTWPEHIYLTHGNEMEVPAFTDGWGVSWCDDPVESTDVAYVRHDLYAALEDQVRALRQAEPWVPVSDALAHLEDGEEYPVAIRSKGALYRRILPYHKADGRFYPASGFYFHWEADEDGVGGQVLVNTANGEAEVEYVLVYPPFPAPPQP
jgi:hypothetical protein